MLPPVCPVLQVTEPTTPDAVKVVFDPLHNWLPFEELIDGVAGVLPVLIATELLLPLVPQALVLVA